MLPVFQSQAEGEAYLRIPENYHKYVNDESGMGLKMLAVLKASGWNWDPVPVQPESEAAQPEANEPVQSEPEESVQPAQAHNVVESGAPAQDVDEVESGKPQADSQTKYQLWARYDADDTNHRRAILTRDKVKLGGVTYVSFPFCEGVVVNPQAEERKIENFFQKHRHYPQGVTLIGEGPEKAHWSKTDGVKLTRLSDVQMREQEWLWTNRIPAGALSTIAGDPDNGKTLLALHIAACVTKGWKMYGDDKSAPRGEVLILGAEDDPEKTLAPRLVAAGANLEKCHLLESVTQTNAYGQRLALPDRLAQLDADLEKIRKLLDTNPNIRLIVVDPISSFLGSASMNKEQEVRQVLTPFAVLARERNITVLLIMHLNKNSETKSAMDRVGGAKALVGLGRSAWLCTREPKPDQPLPEGQIDQGERFNFLKLKNNLAPSKVGGLIYTIRTQDVEVETRDGRKVTKAHPLIHLVGETNSTAQEVIIEGKNAVGRPKKSEACEEWLKKYLTSTGGYDTVNRIYARGEDEGYSERTLQRARENIGLAGRWIGGLKHWGFPANLPPADTRETHDSEHGGTRPGSGRKRRNTVDLK